MFRSSGQRWFPVHSDALDTPDRGSARPVRMAALPSPGSPTPASCLCHTCHRCRRCPHLSEGVCVLTLERRVKGAVGEAGSPPFSAPGSVRLAGWAGGESAHGPLPGLGPALGLTAVWLCSCQGRGVRLESQVCQAGHEPTGSRRVCVCCTDVHPSCVCAGALTSVKPHLFTWHFSTHIT